MNVLPRSVKDTWSHSGGPENGLLWVRFLAKRYAILGITAFLAVTLLLRMFYYTAEVNVEQSLPVPNGQEQSSRWPGRRLPPLYPQYHQYELSLPQHHWQAASHEAEPKFFYVPGHTRGSGWGNVMQEILLNAYLAYKANRAFVFYNYTWNDDGSDYSDYNGKPIPSRIPLSALVAGPLVGAPFPPGTHAPPAISVDYWNEVCQGRTLSIDRKPVHDTAGSWMLHDITRAWVDKLATVPDQCVEVLRSSGNVYDWIMFGDRHALHGVWADLAASPIFTHFNWSPLVELAFDNNREVISPSRIFERPISASASTLSAERYPEIKGLLVLHLRRGDYEGHCVHLGKWSSTFLAFNALPQLEQFDPPDSHGSPSGENTPENIALYRHRCYPEPDEVLARIREVQQQSGARAQGLENVYIMTNGPVEWVDDLKGKLMDTGAFKHVASSRDTILTWEQKYVAQAMDMIAGQRAQVFIGNGWSSLTGGIVAMRTANGFHPDTTKFF